MKDRTSIIEKAAKEFQYLTRTKERTNRYSKDKNKKKHIRLAEKVAHKYMIRVEFFTKLVIV